MASNSGKARKHSLWKRFYFNVVPFRYRYSPVFAETLDFLMESQMWPRQRLLDYQFSQLRDILQYAYDNVPYYTRIFNERDFRPQHMTSPADISRLPLLTKSIVREERGNLISKAYSGKTVTFRTSGSTGERLEFLGDDSMYKKEAAFVLRAFRAHGARLYDKPSVWLRRYVPKDGEPLWYYDHELKRLYMSPYHITRENAPAYVDAINASGSDMLVGYPSSVYILACLVEELGLSMPHLRSAHVASEMIPDQWKEQSERILGIPVKAHYGQTERVAFMFQSSTTDSYCDNLEYGFTEFIKNDQGDHDIIATGFLNKVMPLIRYQTGDTAQTDPDALASGDTGLPYSVKKISGRRDDILVAASGSRLPGVNFYTMMYKIDGVKMFQLIQRQLGALEVNLVIEQGHVPRQVMDAIKQNLEDRLGQLRINFNIMDTIARDPRTQKIRCIQSFV